jgi:LCP family protein required for cell wall assembly
MDIKGVKPVASRKKQRPLGANTKTHFSGLSHSVSFRGAQKPQDAQPKERPATSSTAAASMPVQNSKAFPIPRYHAPERPAHLVHKRLNKRRVALRGVALCLVIAVTLAGLLVWNGYVRVHKVFHGSSMVAALAPKLVAPGKLGGEGNGRVNILLVGTGGTGHTKPNVTNSIMLLSIDPINNTVSLVNIPLDLWVQQPVTNYGKEQKIDVVYESGVEHYQAQEVNDSDPTTATKSGLGDLDQVVEKLTGVTIDYHILMNFQGFQQAVDAVGGVSINAPSAVKDWSLARYNNGNAIIAQAGEQQMNGEQALLYVRSHVTTSEFGSLERQLQVLIALKDKVLTVGTLSNPAKLDALTNALGNNVYTDLSTDGAERLDTILQRIDDPKVDTVSLSDASPQLLTDTQVDGESALEPVAGSFNYNAIQDYVRSHLPDGYLKSESAPITVISGTAPGAALSGAFLSSYGYNVTVTTMNNQQVSHFTLVDLSDGKDPYTLHYLENRYKVKAVTRLPSGIVLPSAVAKFVIIEP